MPLHYPLIQNNINTSIHVDVLSNGFSTYISRQIIPYFDKLNRDSNRKDAFYQNLVTNLEE